MSSQPRILVTGFSVFPGAPVNPTEALIARLGRAIPEGTTADTFRARVLDVDYATISDQLAAACEGFAPDIAIHFGLARQSAGFRLERVARNSHADARPDQTGGLPREQRVCAGPERLASTLPLERIAHGLAEACLPVQWSDDAGGYLCNTVMTLSLAHVCSGLAPAMSGFIHVPPLKKEERHAPDAMSLADLERGARLVIAACIDEWHQRSSS